jgi:uncharacterized integral membrane protein (TIGR00698 family)
MAVLPGLLVATALALVATALARVAPLIGAPVIAILLGVAVRAVRGPGAALLPGIAYSARKVLQFGIVVSGLGISFVSVIRTGLAALPVTLGTIAVALVLAPIVGRAFRLDRTMRLLVGVGTAICGASAIAAVSTVIDADEADVALAIATVFSYNVVAVLVFPPLGHLLGMSQHAFGLWAGTAINDTSSVVAAGYAYGREAGTHATIVKLTRATLILPIVAAIALLHVRARGTGAPVVWRKVVPWFILWFLAAALVGSTGLIRAAWHPGIANAATFLISIALAAIGLQTQLARLLRTGARPLALGFVLWGAVALSSLAIQRATGQ